jgi:hypothetical protein
VVRWHRAGFKLYWKWISRAHARAGRKPTPKALREIIFRMVVENNTWGAPRIHGELKMLGYKISERTVLRWMRKAPRNVEPARRWAVFLRNHREAIAAMDFFTVPTVTFGVLYGFFVIAHERRRILHFNVTRQPTSAWEDSWSEDSWSDGTGTLRKPSTVAVRLPLFSARFWLLATKMTNPIDNRVLTILRFVGGRQSPDA